MEDKLYSISEIARILSIPDSTVRYYKEKFPQFLRSEGEGKKRKYHSSAIEVLRTISQLMNKNIQCCDIEKVLQDKYEAIFETDCETVNEIVANQQVPVFDTKELIFGIAQLINNTTNKQNEIIELQNTKIDLLIEEIRVLREEQAKKKWFWQR